MDGHTAQDDNFTLKAQNGVDMAKQYANMYYLRLVKLKNRVLARAKQKWAEPTDSASFWYCCLGTQGPVLEADRDTCVDKHPTSL